MYYRVTCENIGIYEYLRNYIFEKYNNPKGAWNNFLNLECNSWLNKPDIYINNTSLYISYFTEKGYLLFINNVFKEIKNIIKDKNYKIDIVNINDNELVYKDEYQVVIEKNKLSNSREFCSKVKELASNYNLSFFVVTEGASAISNNGCNAVKHARDEHIKWEEENGYDPYEDWSNNRGE